MEKGHDEKVFEEVGPIVERIKSNWDKQVIKHQVIMEEYFNALRIAMEKKMELRESAIELRLIHEQTKSITESLFGIAGEGNEKLEEKS